MSEKFIQNKAFNILVTGSTGFIGKKLLTQLSDSGYTVKAMSRLKYPDTENIQYVRTSA